MSYVIFDIETVPDSTLWTAPPPKPRAKKGGGFPPLYAHRPIAIGVLALNEETYAVETFAVAGTTTFGDNEGALIAAWSGWMAQLQPVLVSFNGRAFDVPVLALRAIRHGVSIGWHNKEYRSRYGEQHIDLFDEATVFGGVGRDGFSLSNLSALIGLPTKGEDGSMVAGMHAEGQHAKIEAYCGMDLVRTAFLFMRYQLMRGRLSLEGYRVAAVAIKNLCVERQLSGVLFGADEKRLLLAE